MKSIRVWAITFAAVLVFVCSTLHPIHDAKAFITPLPVSLANEVLSETVPTAFAPFDADVLDFEIEWENGVSPKNIRVQLEPGTLQWVRVMDVLVLPRARVIAEGGTISARISSAGFSQGITPRAVLPVALLTDRTSGFEVAWSEKGEEHVAKGRFKFKPRAELGSERFFYDPSCSRFSLRLERSTAIKIPQSSQQTGQSWAYVGCRFVELEGKPMASSLEVFLYWDGVGDEIFVEGIKTRSTLPSVWPLRLRSEPGQVHLGDLTLNYRMPQVYRRGSLGLGIGPYLDRFEGEGDLIETVAPILTLYGSYFVTEDMRFVAFGAATMDRSYTTDLGVYVHTVSLRVIDRRVVSNLLLGVHGIGFRAQGQYRVMAGLPQGVELTFIDAFKKGHNLTAGMFLYPMIEGKAYNNVWLRWGSGALFGELNYISWSERPDGHQYNGKYLGVSVGFPLGRFL